MSLALDTYDKQLIIENHYHKLKNWRGQECDPHKLSTVQPPFLLFRTAPLLCIQSETKEDVGHQFPNKHPCKIMTYCYIFLDIIVLVIHSVQEIESK